LITFGQLLLAVSVPSIVALIGILVNKHDFAMLRQDIADVRRQIQYLIDLLINHEGRIAAVEERTKPK
jgi:hypothetical protein